MATFNLIANENSATQSCPKNPDDQNRSGVSGAGSENTNSFLSLLNYQPDIDDNFFFFAKNPHEAKYQLLINKQTSVKHFEDSQGFMKYPSHVSDVYPVIKIAG